MNWNKWMKACGGAGFALALAACGGPEGMPGEDVGSVGQGVNWGPAPACGTVLATIDGQAAYSNGTYQRTGSSCAGSGTFGLRYQCVEFAQRYFHNTQGVAATIWSGVGSAYQMCTYHPAGTTIRYGDNGYVPVHGDLYIVGQSSSYPYGHVAVIDGVWWNGSTKMDSVVEQNSSSDGWNSYVESAKQCWISAP